MANPAIPGPIGLQWKKWIKASDPAPYKGCIIFLLTLHQLCFSGVTHCRRKMRDGSAHVWRFMKRKEVCMVETRRRKIAVLVMSSLTQLLVLLCGDIHLYPRNDDFLCASEDAALLVLSPSSKEQFYSDIFSSFLCCLVVLVPHLTHVATCLWRYVQQYSRVDHPSLCHIQLWIYSEECHHHFSLRMKQNKHMYLPLQCSIPLLWSCLSSSSSLALWNCMKKRVAEAMTYSYVRSCSPRRSALRLGVMIVFVTQMLLMMAGDVEPNPGPGNLNLHNIRAVRTAIFSVRHKWYDIGVELEMSPYTLDAIKTQCLNNVADCLTEMLKQWLSGTSPPPTWSSLIQALVSPPVGEKRLAEDIREQYCNQDGNHADEHPEGTARINEKRRQQFQPTEMAGREVGGCEEKEKDKRKGRKRQRGKIQRKSGGRGRRRKVEPQVEPGGSGLQGQQLKETPTKSSCSSKGRKRKRLELIEGASHENQVKEVKVQDLATASSEPLVTSSFPTVIPSLQNSSHVLTASLCTPSISPFIRYADYLRAVYSKSPVAIDRDKWPPTPSKTYVRLALVKKEKVSRGEADHFTRLTLQGHIDQILKAKQPIAMEDILKDSDVCFVVIEGAPGIGKSTFVWELCRQWPTLESLKRFSLVVLLRLREERVQIATVTSDLFPCLDEPSLGRSVGEEVAKRKGDGILLVFDGFDEFPAELRRKSLVAEVISGTYLPKATVLVTSRPSATAELLCQAHVGKHIEVIGFSDIEIKEYAQSVFGSGSELETNFLTYLSANPVVRGIMYNPLNCGMVLEVYRESSLSERPIPHTQTQLYTELSLCLLSRHLSAAGNPLARRLPNRLEDLEDLPHNRDLYQQLVRLGRLAFEGRVREEVIFKHLPEGCSALGLLNTCSELYGRRENVTYNFFHLTLQEYLGAFHISQLPGSEQRDLFVKYGDLQHLDVLWRFVAGLTRMQAIGWECFEGRRVTEEGRVYNVDNGYVVEDGEVKFWPSVAQCLYEAQDPGSCASIFSQSRVKYCGQGCSTPFDAYALGYCVSLHNSDWSVELGVNGLGSEVVEMLLCGLKSVNNDGGSVEELVLSVNPIKDEGMKYLRQFPHQVLQSIRTLDISSCDLGPAGLDILADTFPLLSALQSLDISDNPGGNKSTVKLLQSLGKHQRVEKLRMADTGIGTDDILALSGVVHQSSSLRELCIGRYKDIPPECVQQLVKTVLSPSSLRALEVRVHSSIPPLDYIETIGDNLTWLQFGSWSKKLPTEFSDRGGIQLSNILKENTTLKELSLHIPLKHTEVKAILESLESNHTLTKLRLSEEYHAQFFSESERLALDHHIEWW